MNDEIIEKLVVEHPEIKWYIDTAKINEKFEEDDISVEDFIKTIPEDKRDLYIYDDFYAEIKPNWNGIYCKLFNIDKNKLDYRDLLVSLPPDTRIEDIKIPLCNIPIGMKEFFEVDNQGNPTGNFNWDYVMYLNDLAQNVDDKEHPITIYFPDHAGLIMENIDNPSELYDNLIGGGKKSRTGVDLNCPFKEIRDNKKIMLDIIDISGNNLKSVNIWELASERLKKDSDFVHKVAQIVGEDIFGCIAEFEGVEPEELLQEELNKSNDLETEIDINSLGYDPVSHTIVDFDDEEFNYNDEEMEYYTMRSYDDDYETYKESDYTPNLSDVIYNILRGRISDYRSNQTFGESNNWCDIGQYSDMPGEEEIAIILNSIDSKLLAQYFKSNPEDISLYVEMQKKYGNIQELDESIEVLDEVEQYYDEDWDYYEDMEYYERLDRERREDFEECITKDDIVEFYSSKSTEDLNYEFGPNVSRMVGFDQRNSHHCYDLWEHTLRTVEGIKKDGLTEDQFKKLRIAAFFHDIGKPDVARFNEQTGQQVFYGHATHSVEVAKPIIEGLGYDLKDVEQIAFLIGHHDDFISYKSKLAPFMKNHEFIRGITPASVAEKIIENKYDFEKMGYNKDEIRAICYTLANGKEPNFRTKDGPIQIPVDIDEVQRKMDSGKYTSEYDATMEDYQMLLQLCKADAGAQREKAIQNGRVVGSKAEKLENMNNIEACIPEAYRLVQRITSKDRFVSNIVEYATKKVELRDKDSKAKKLAQEYEEQLPKSQHSIDED